MKQSEQDVLSIINYLEDFIKPKLSLLEDKLERDLTFLFTRKEKTDCNVWPQIPSFNRFQIRFLKETLLKMGFGVKITDRCEITFQRFNGDLNSAINTLLEIGTYTKSWDGYEANSIDPKIIESSIKLLTQFYHNIPLPEITPNPNGTISFEWETKTSYGHLEIGITTYAFHLNTPRIQLHANREITKINPDEICLLVGKEIYSVLTTPVPASICRIYMKRNKK